eukprot:UN04351
MTTEISALNNGDDTVADDSRTYIYDPDTSTICLEKLSSLTLMPERLHRESIFEHMHPNSSKREGESSLINVTYNMLDAIIGTGIL